MTITKNTNKTNVGKNLGENKFSYTLGGNVN
jgi:hypothetical protein